MKRPTITKEQLKEAIESLGDSHTGREVLKDLNALFTNKGRNLDLWNQEHVLTIMFAVFGPFAGTTVEMIKEELCKHLTFPQ